MRKYFLIKVGGVNYNMSLEVKNEFIVGATERSKKNWMKNRYKGENIEGNYRGNTYRNTTMK